MIGQSGTISPEHCAAVWVSTFSMRLRSAIFARTSARCRSVRSLTSAQVCAPPSTRASRPRTWGDYTKVNFTYARDERMQYDLG